MSTAQEELAEAVVDAILEKIFQGRRDHLREQAYAIARKVAPQHPWDYTAWARVEKETGTLKRADIVNSTRKNGEGHSLILDIDYPVYVSRSTNGNSHLFLDLPDALSTEALKEILEVLGRHGVIEEGYASASIERGYTSVRRPGRKKGRPIPYCNSCGRRGDEINEYLDEVRREQGRADYDLVDIQDVEDWIYANEGTISTETGLFTCTKCYLQAGMPLNKEIF